MSSDVKKIEISSCDRVVFTSNAIRNKTNLRTIILRNIPNLSLENFSIYRNSFNKNQYLTVIIINSNIHKIPSFSFGGITQLAFVNVTIASISPFAFDSITNMNSIRFFATKINKIKSKAFNKISTNYLVINGCNFDSLSTRAFSNIYIKQTFFIMHSNISGLESGTFNIYYSKQFNVTNSNFNNLERRVFNMQTAVVLFRNVSFSRTVGNIFAGIRSPSRDLDRTPDFSLYSATFDCFDGLNLKINTNSFKADVENIHFKKSIEKCR